MRDFDTPVKALEHSRIQETASGIPVSLLTHASLRRLPDLRCNLTFLPAHGGNSVYPLAMGNKAR